MGEIEDRCQREYKYGKQREGNCIAKSLCAAPVTAFRVVAHIQGCENDFRRLTIKPKDNERFVFCLRLLQLSSLNLHHVPV
jgi:hypothetical protein